jgi:hypothetical protein
VTWKLEKSLANVPYDQFDISEEVQEQVWIEKSAVFSFLHYCLSLTLWIVALPGCIGESSVAKSHGKIWVYEFKGGVFSLFPAD